jgi:hypothetical protein
MRRGAGVPLSEPLRCNQSDPLIISGSSLGGMVEFSMYKGAEDGK